MIPIAGRVAYVFAESHFDVDRIVGPENISERDLDRLAGIVMRDFDPDFHAMVRRGDLLVGGHNFGYGHPHYAPMQGMRHFGIRAVIAESFSPGYWREEMEEGFPQITCPGILAAVQRWDEVTVSIEKATFVNLTRGVTLPIELFSPRERRMLRAGGLAAILREPEADAL